MSATRFLPFLAWTGEWRDGRIVRADLVAGLTGAILVLPQGIAFAAIAGMPPQYGLYTAMVTAIVAALFGSSRQLVSGPTTAISLMVFDTLARRVEPGSAEYVQLALTLTLLAGAFQLGLGLARLGAVVNFVSHSVVAGFTAGAAILIGTSQLKHVLGVPMPHGADFLGTWAHLFEHLDQVHWRVAATAGASLLAALVCRRIDRRLPHMLVGMATGAVLCHSIAGPELGVPMVAEIPRSLPVPSLPGISLDLLRDLGSKAFAIGLIGLIEAVSISRSLAARTGQTIDGNQEFIGQGLSNLVGSFFSCYAGSGSFTRSGVNLQAGARTPYAALVAALTLAVLVLVCAPYSRLLPVAAMGGVILLVCAGLPDLHYLRRALRSGVGESAVLITTFLSTLLLHLEFAILLGVLLSLMLYLHRSSHPEAVELAPDPDHPRRRLTNLARKPLPRCPQLAILRLDRSIYFGSVAVVRQILREATPPGGPRHLLLVASGINEIDLSGAEMLEGEARRLEGAGGGLHLCGVKRAVLRRMEGLGLVARFGAARIHATKEEAIAAIVPSLDAAGCAACRTRIFRECATRPASSP